MLDDDQVPRKGGGGVRSRGVIVCHGLLTRAKSLGEVDQT